ncbi:MAG: hypothetical protein SWY16_27325 [Cyanobacteriota bacterium]|nr:hypothetical protein [Cyanobacteriota bacterium]
MNIHEALILIDEWVASLDDEELPEKCREAGNDFFSFLQRRGFQPDVFIGIVLEVTGQAPQNLWRLEDAKLLRHYLYAYYGEEQELSREELRDGRDDDDWLEDSTNRFFGR